jgi:hypothetical protein
VRGVLAVLAAVAIICLGSVAAPVAASTYPPSTATVTTDQSVYSLNSPVIVTASGFSQCVGQTLTFTITPPGGGTPIVITGTVGPDGALSVTIPAGFAQAGTYRVIATCGGLQANTTFRVVGLVQTGADVGRWLVSGAGVLVAGLAMLVVAGRRRRPAAASATG